MISFLWRRVAVDDYLASAEFKSDVARIVDDIKREIDREFVEGPSWSPEPRVPAPGDPPRAVSLSRVP